MVLSRGAHWCSLQEILQRDRGTHLLEGFRHVKSQLTSLPSMSLMPGHSWLVYIWSRPVATRTTAAKLHLLLEHVYKQLQGIASAWWSSMLPSRVFTPRRRAAPAGDFDNSGVEIYGSQLPRLLWTGSSELPRVYWIGSSQLPRPQWVGSSQLPGLHSGGHMSQLEGLRPSSDFRHEERGDLGSNLDCARYPWRCMLCASGTRWMCGRLSYETLAGAFLVHGVFAGAAASTNGDEEVKKRSWWDCSGESPKTLTLLRL